MALLCFLVVAAALGGAQATSFLSKRSRHAPYYWPHARGHPGSYSTTDIVGPETELNASLAWSWHHPDGRYHTVVTSGPLIDDKKNIYLASEDGIRKFNPDGEELWFYKPIGPVPTCPSLMNGALFGNTQAGFVFALDMETGKELWVKRPAESIAGDTAYVESYDGLVVTGVDPSPSGGAMRVVGLDAKTGGQFWEYKSPEVMWNFQPMFTADDSVILMDIHGGVYKLGLHNGTLLWKANPPEASAQQSFSDGGVILGPDGTSYTCSNYEGSGQEGQRGALRAFALQDGHLLWEQVLDKPCNSWPVVTSDGATVVVPSGSFVASPAASDPSLMMKFGKNPSAMTHFSLSLGSKELKTYGMPDKHATMRAFDAKTGEPSWSQDLPPYGRLAAAGDEEGYLERRELHHRDQCLPAQFGAPTISGDGTVYVGRADGNLYAMRPEGEGAVISTFQTGAGFLHPGTSWAPGMMAVTSCDGLFVWKF
mmetsp:Transcript_50512/g.110211  ORF Transcript_50512/g.110211 Transcript_50512/m.110211 type:complete len:481 (-) Transcript_50512:97-1539(-)